MRATYIEAPARYLHRGYQPCVFLAGGITGCPDWQAEAVALFTEEPVVVLNPRRLDFPIGDPSAAPAQIAWEYEHLQRADVVLFWFAGAAIQPIALFELGAASARSVAIAVGADQGYPRRLDVVEQLGHVRPGLPVYDTLADTVAKACRWLRVVRLTSGQ